LDCFRRVGKGEARRALGLPPRGQIVLCVGQLILRKGHHILINAMAHLNARLPELRAFIIGEGVLRESLKRQVSALGLEQHVYFAGAIKNEDLFRWYCAADVTCLASSREGFPCVLLESLACGTPVVATNIEGTRELVSSADLGLLVERDAVAIAEGLAKALRLTWSNLAHAAHSRCLTWTQVGDGINEILLSSVHLPRTMSSLTLNPNMQ
jgi:glycosyltransferase involved in cell wall biosynthesis